MIAGDKAANRRLGDRDESWKERLYSAYVSSGQTRDSGEPAEVLFGPAAPYFGALISRHIPPDRNLRIADLGCGHGIFLHYLKSAGYVNVSGIDLSAEQVALAHRLGICEVQCGMIEEFLGKSSGSSVDVILLMDILEHLTRQELLWTLDQVIRVLRPGGKCIAHVPNAEGLYGMAIRYGDLTHELAFTPKSVEQAFRTVGFKTVECHEEKPVISGFAGLARRMLWELGTFPHRVLQSAEVGGWGFILSQNMLVTACKVT